MSYVSREDAGKQLAQVLRRFKSNDLVVLALPRGGVILGAEIAKELEAPLGLVLIKKIGHPLYPEYAIGAIAEDEPPVYNPNEIEYMDEYWLRGAEARAQDMIRHRRELYYDGDFIPPNVEHKVVILVDDGIATGLSMEAAVRAIRNKNARRIIVAVPVASPESVDILEDIADRVIVLENPFSFSGVVGNHYMRFEQINDEEVQMLLREPREQKRHTIPVHSSFAVRHIT